MKAKMSEKNKTEENNLINNEIDYKPYLINKIKKRSDIKNISSVNKYLSKLLKNKEINKSEYSLLVKTLITKYVYDEVEEKMNKYITKTLYNIFKEV